MLEYAYEQGHSGVGLTDHESVSGHIRAFNWWEKKMKEAETPEEKERAENFKVVLGNEIYIAREGLTSKNHGKDENFFHFLLLAKDAAGQAQLRELSTLAWEKAYMRGVMRRFNYLSELREVISPNQGHVAATTACIANLAGHAFLTMPKEEAETLVDSYLKELIEIFGESNLYIELSPALYSEQVEYNKFMYERYKDILPFIITNDVHYLRESDFRTLELLLGEKREPAKYYKYAYFMTWKEIVKNMSYLPVEFLEKAAQNALDIGEESSWYSLKNPQKIPVVPYKSVEPSKDLLKEAMSYEFIEKFLNSDHEPDRVMALQVVKGFDQKEETTTDRRKLVFNRLNDEWKELWGISKKLGVRLSDYLLTMSWMIEKMWETGTLIGPGRGSAVAFATNYYLDITDVNPLDYPLHIPHWRFISESRVELPDIDIDTPGADRQKVLHKLTEEFQALGGDVVQVATYGTATTRSALRTIGRGLDIPIETLDYISSLIPSERGKQFSLEKTYYGDDDHEPVKAFVEQMDENPELWEHSLKIEGLITQMGVHPGGVILSNRQIHENNSIVRNKKGVRLTAYDLHESEDTGLIKYDALSVDGLGKLKTAVYLLLQHNKIDWQGSLKDTFQHYFSPRKLEPTSKVWENIAAGRVNSLFQLNTQVGQAAVRLLHVTSIEEIGMVNSLMRLQPQSAGERQPLQIFAEFREDINLWYQELRRYGLNDEEVKIMEEHLLMLSGVADTQEVIMQLSMDERISGFSVAEANFLRKSVASINPTAQLEVRQLFYEKGRELGTRQQLLDYVWSVQINRQLGYAFSLPHVAAYSYVALQEAIIYSHYPEIYWNTACLIDDAGAFAEEDFPDLIESGYLEASDKYYEIMEADDIDEIDIVTTAIDRDKIATSIAMFQEVMTILPPDINTSGFGFTLNEEDNSVKVGLKVVSRLGNRLIYNILRARPFASFHEFLENVKIPRDRVVMLIKAGAFRNVSAREPLELLRDYTYMLSEPKKVLNGRNINMLIQMNLLPSELLAEQHNFNWYKHISKTRNVRKDYFQLDNPGLAYYSKHYDEGELEYFNNGTFIKRTYAKSLVDKTNETIKIYIKNNHDTLLNKVNEILYEEMWEKYKMKSEAEGEMESLRMYTGKHPLSDFILSYDKLEDIKEDHFVGQFNIRGKKYPKHYIYRIVGTVVAKDKMKNTVTLLTPEGAINVKLWNDTFSYFDRKVTSVVDGQQITIQDSFFEVGTHLVVFGRKSNDMFFPKKYRDTGVDSEIFRLNIVNGLIETEEKISESSAD